MDNFLDYVLLENIPKKLEITKLEIKFPISQYCLIEIEGSLDSLVGIKAFVDAQSGLDFYFLIWRGAEVSGSLIFRFLKYEYL